MKVVEQKGSCNFQIKIGNKYVTVAILQPWFLSKYLHKYSLYLYYYGVEFEEGIYACQHTNGNVSIEVRKQKDECYFDFIERVQRIIVKKLYRIGSSILEEIKFTE